MNDRIKKMSSLLLILFLLLPFSLVFSQEQADLQKDQELDLRAKKRLYPGGVDERSLQVQENLPYPARVVNLLVVQKEILSEQ